MNHTSLSPSLPMLAHYHLPPPLVNMIGEYLSEQDPDDPRPYSIDSPRLYDLHYKKYQHFSILLELYKGINGEIPTSLKQAEHFIHSIRLRTAQLEDMMIMKCFLNYCCTYPLSTESESRYLRSVYKQLPLCLRGEGTSLCPLIARVNRFLQYTSSSPSLHLHYITSGSPLLPNHSFLNVSLHEPLHALVCSIQKTYKSHQTVRDAVQANLDNSPNPSPTLRQRIKLILSYSMIVGCMLLFTALKITLFMISTIACCAIAAPFVFMIATCREPLAYRYLPNTWRELVQYVFLCMGIGAVAGFAYGAYQTFPYLRELWRERRSIVQLHQESLPAFKRLWVDHKQAFGPIKGTHSLLKTLFTTGAVPPPEVARQTA